MAVDTEKTRKDLRKKEVDPVVRKDPRNKEEVDPVVRTMGDQSGMA